LVANLSIDKFNSLQMRILQGVASDFPFGYQ